MKKAPPTVEVSGALGEQLSFFSPPEFCPNLPNHGSHTRKALIAMLDAPITQIEWLKNGCGWRLSSTINLLNKHGWKVHSGRVNKGGITIAIYSLTPTAKQQLKTLLVEVKNGKE